MQRDAGFVLHEDLWDGWSRGLRFAKEICFPGECVTEELSMCCCNEDEQTKSQVKNVVMNACCVLRRGDSVRSFGMREVGGVDEGPTWSIRTSDVQHVFGSIIVAEFDPRLLPESKQMGIDFMSQLEVHRRPRQWASGIFVIPTKWVDERGPSNLSIVRDCVKKKQNGRVPTSSVQCLI